VPDRVLKEITFSGLEFLFLLGLWMLFVSQLRRAELVAGVCAAALGAVAEGIVKARRLAKFRPRSRWLALFTWELWYVLTGSAALMRALARRLTGKKSEAQFRVVPFRAGGTDSKSEARRAIAITATSVAPDTIVVGIERERDFLLLHQIAPAATPQIARRLGAKS
jgi:multisubunit Na+/H+ antiporter MnhE subunit